MSMTRDEIIAASRVPNTDSVYFLGCFESRVTLYAQQVRALNLVDAIIASGRVRHNGRVAVVGGGAAGITAAAAFALEMPDLQAIDLYEFKDELLHLQVGSTHRYLHPHIYDWPEAGALRLDAGLPILNWSADTAGNVADRLVQQFTAIEEKHRALRVHYGRKVTRVQPYDRLGCRVFTSREPTGVDHLYDAVILSPGFGYERDLTDRTFSYWDPVAQAASIRTAASESRIFVSGNGDGGLVDFMTLALRTKSHQELCHFITEYPGIGPAMEKLLEIERKIWDGSAAPDIYAMYQDRVLESLPVGMLLDVAEMLRPDVRIVFHTREPHLLRRDTAVINRLGAFLAIEADRTQERDKIEVITGINIDGSALDPEVKFSNGATFSPSYRFLRFGSLKEENLEPFKEHASAWRAIHAPSPSGYRPATPDLEPLASARFQKHRTTLPTVQPYPHTEVAGALTLRLDMPSPNTCAWRSSVPVADAARFWRNNAPPVEIVCDMQAVNAGSLATAIARLAVHSKQCHLYSSDSHGWGDIFNTYTGRARPGPHVDAHFVFRRIRQAVSDLPVVEEMPPDTLADRIHAALDVDVIARLNETLIRCLQPHPTLELGWPIEAMLRSQIRSLWQTWHLQLEGSALKRRRFLLLLASIEDRAEMNRAALVHVGPKIMTLHLARSAILALAVSLVLEEQVSPSDSFPGNLLGGKITAHASGVSWMDGKDLGPELISHPWTTTFVLLSELSEAEEQLRAELRRLDKAEGETLRISDVSPDERPIIIGCDFVFRKALEGGREAVRKYVARLVRDRAIASAAYLE